MKFNQLYYFKTVAEMGKISLAAKKLYVSPPALSIAISNLENDLGVQLFDRSNNKIILNEQGRTYLAHVNKIFDDLDLAKETVVNMTPESERLTNTDLIDEQ